MGKIKIRNHKFALAEITKLAQFSLHETLIFLGQPLETNDMTICVGIGLVKKIEKGEDFDVVGMDFGRGFTRDIYVKNNHARRQIYTLKKGQYAWFYGLMKYYTLNGKTKPSFFAKAFQGWYALHIVSCRQAAPYKPATLQIRIDT